MQESELLSLLLLLLFMRQLLININMPAYYHGPLWDYHQRILIN